MARKRSQMVIEDSSSEVSLYSSDIGEKVKSQKKPKKTKTEASSQKIDNKKIVHNLLISLNRPITSTELLIFLKQYKITKAVLTPIITALEKEDRITVKLYGKTQVFFRKLEVIDEERNTVAKKRNDELVKEHKKLQERRNELQKELLQLKNLKNENLIIEESKELEMTIQELKGRVEAQSSMETVDRTLYDKLLVKEKKLLAEQKKREKLFKNIKYQLEDGFGKKWSEIYEDIFN